MTDTDQLLLIVKDRTIGIDAWSDYYLNQAINIAERLRNSGNLEKCLDAISSFDEEAKIRLFEVITAVPSTELVPKLLHILSEAEGELAEVLIDGLRSWPLTVEQKKIFLLSSKKFRGQSRIIDKIISSIDTSE